MSKSDRPEGTPTYGWTESGKVIKLAGKVVSGFDPIVKVTKEGWDDWYPVEDGEYRNLERKPPKGRWEMKRFERWEGISDSEGDEGRGAYWRY